MSLIFKDREYASRYFKTVPTVMLQTLLMAVIGATDTIVVGFLSSESLAAVSLANQVAMIINCLVGAAGVGISALAAQYYGKKDLESVQRVMVTGLQYSVLLGVFFFLLALLFPGIIMKVLTNDATLVTLGESYLRYICVSFLLTPFVQSWMTILKNSGRTRIVTAISVVSGVLNLVLDLIFVFGMFGLPAMGISGAALCTSVVMVVNLLILLATNRKENAVRVEFGKLLNAYKGIRRKFFHYAFPPMIQNGAWILANTAIAAIIGHLGKDAVAANAMTMLVGSLLVSLYNGASTGTGILLGQELGNGQFNDAKRHAVDSMKMNVLIGSLICAFLLLFRNQIAALNPNLSAQSQQYLKFMLAVLGFKCVFGSLCSVIATGMLSVGGDLKYLTILDIVNLWCIIVPIGLLSAFVLELPVPVVFVLVNLDETTKIVHMVRRAFAWKWVKNLTKVEWAEPGRHQRIMRDRLLENMPTGALLLGSYGNIVYANSAAGRILEMDPQDVQGSSLLRYYIETGSNDGFANLLLDSLYRTNELHSQQITYQGKQTSKQLLVHTMMMQEEDLRLGLCAFIEEVPEALLPEQAESLN